MTLTLGVPAADSRVLTVLGGDTDATERSDQVQRRDALVEIRGASEPRGNARNDNN